MKVFISIPMAGKTEQQIKDEMAEIRKDACARLDKSPDEVEFLDSFFEDYKPEGGNISLKFLAKSIMCLADADCIYMAPGWNTARVCRIEHTCASEYGLQVIEAVRCTTRREMLRLVDGDRFYIYGEWHTAKGDAHLSGDASCSEHLVYDTYGDSFFESEFPDK